MAHIRGNLKFSKAATQFINNTNRFSFDAELYQHGPNKVNMLHFHDFYEFTVYLGKEPAKYALGGQEHEVVFGDIVRCDLMDEHVWLLSSNELYTRFTVGLSPSFVMSSSTKEDNLLKIFSRGEASYPVLRLGSLDTSR